jgi:hypothetical protein
MINPTMGMANRQLNNYRFTKDFPTRDNCDPANPVEAFLWMLVALPGVNGASLTAPISYNMIVSEHLWECGARPAAEPIKKWIPPAATGPHWLTSPGRWVALDAPEGGPVHPADAAIEKLSHQQRAELFERLKRMHDSGSL